MKTFREIYVESLEFGKLDDSISIILKKQAMKSNKPTSLKNICQESKTKNIVNHVTLYDNSINFPIVNISGGDWCPWWTKTVLNTLNTNYVSPN